MKEFIQFKKQRELGDIITDIFKFLRLTWKPLFGLIFRIAGPALIALVLSYVYYLQSTVGSMGTFGFDDNMLGKMFLSLLLIVVFGATYYALTYGTVMYSIKSYIKNEGVIIKEEVISGVKEDFWRLLGLSFLFMLIVGFAFVLCFFPVLYFGPVVASCFAIFVFEKRGVSESISYCFDLIKGEFWITLATYVVIFILYYIIIIIFQIPQYLYFFISDFTMSDMVSADPGDMFDWGYIALNAFALIGQYVLYSIIVISTAFVYFNLNERRNFTGTMETIESIGKREE